MLNKRISSLILIGVLSSSLLVGCNSNDTEEVETTDTQVEETITKEEEEESGYKVTNYDDRNKGYNIGYRAGEVNYNDYQCVEHIVWNVISSVTYNEYDARPNKEDWNDNYFQEYKDYLYGEINATLDKLEQDNQMNNESYKLLKEVKEIYNGEPIDESYFIKASELFEKANKEEYDDAIATAINTRDNAIKIANGDIGTNDTTKEEDEEETLDMQQIQNKSNELKLKVDAIERDYNNGKMSNEQFISELEQVRTEVDTERNKYYNVNADVSTLYCQIINRIDALKELPYATSQQEYYTIQSRATHYIGEWKESMDKLGLKMGMPQ